MRFKKVSELVTFVQCYRTMYIAGKQNATGKIPERIQYSIEVKVAVCEMLASRIITSSELSRRLDIPNSTLGKWCEQYRRGLYDNLGAAIAVSAPAKVAALSALNVVHAQREELLKKHEEELAKLDAQVLMIEQVEALGFTVTKKAA